VYKVGEPVFLVTEIMDAYIGHKTKKERYEIFVNGEVIPIGNDDILIPNPIAKIQAWKQNCKNELEHYEKNNMLNCPIETEVSLNTSVETYKKVLELLGGKL